MLLKYFRKYELFHLMTNICLAWGTSLVGSRITILLLRWKSHYVLKCGSERQQTDSGNGRLWMENITKCWGKLNHSRYPESLSRVPIFPHESCLLHWVRASCNFNYQPSWEQSFQATNWPNYRTSGIGVYFLENHHFG